MSRVLVADILDKISAAVDRFREQCPSAAYDLRHIAVDVPSPYYDLKEKFGCEILPGIYIRPNLRECWVGCKDDIIVFEDGVGLNMGFACIDFYERRMNEN